MLKQEITIPTYGWRATVFYSATCYRYEEIAEELQHLGADGDTMQRALSNLQACRYDTGLTYSNSAERESVVVVGLASSPEQYADSIAHERHHLVQHIGRYYDLDPYGEEACYLTGEIARAMHPVAHLFTSGCRCAEKKLGKRMTEK